MVQEKEFINTINELLKIDNFDKIPEFGFVKNEIKNKAVIYSQEKII